jgi:hypothetical protein
LSYPPVKQYEVAAHVFKSSLDLINGNPQGEQLL